jgi:hypothetical protein
MAAINFFIGLAMKIQAVCWSQRGEGSLTDVSRGVTAIMLIESLVLLVWY